MARLRWAWAWILVVMVVARTAAAAPEKCGGLEKLALQPAPADLLGGRLRLQMLEGMKDAARQRSIMAAPQPDQLETRLFLEKDGKKLVILARETFRRAAGKDLAAEVTPLLPFPPAPLPLASGLKAVAAAPPKLDGKDEAVLALMVATAGADGAVILLSFYVNPEAAKGGTGCTELARKVARTLAPGTRALDLAGGDRPLEDGITLTLAPGQVLVPQEGPDFAVYHVMPVTALADKGGGITIYLGHHPKTPAGGTNKLAATAFGKAVELTGDAMTVEAIVPVPGRDGLVAHISVSAEDPKLQQELVKVASTLRRVQKP